MRSDEASKMNMREILSQILKNTIDASDALTHSHKLMNSPEYQNPSMRLNEKMGNWYNDFERENMNYRRNIGRLFDGLRSITSNNPILSNEIGNIRLQNLNENNLRMGFNKLQGDHAKLDDTAKIVDTYTPSATIGPKVISRKPSISTINNYTPVRRGSFTRGDSRGRVIRNPSIKRLNQNPTTPLNNRTNDYVPSAPKYYRIDENGNRIPMENPTLNNMKKSMGSRNNSLSPINHPYPSVSGEIRKPLGTIQDPANISPIPRTTSMHHLTPNRIQSSPFLHPTKSTQNLQSPNIQQEKRVITTDPLTGAKTVKVFTPRGGNFLRVEPVDMRSRGSSSFTRTPTSIPHLLGNNPVLPLGNILDPQTKRMIDDAKNDFSTPIIEDFEVTDCKYNSLIIF